MPRAHAVVWEARAAAVRAMEHLLSKGRKRIGFIGQKYLSNIIRPGSCLP